MRFSVEDIQGMWFVFAECMCMWSKQEEKWKMTPETHTAAEWQHSSIILCDLQRKRVCCRCLTVKWSEAKALFHISQMTLACQRQSGTDRWLICEVCHLDADYPLLWAVVSTDSLRWPGLMPAGNTLHDWLKHRGLFAAPVEYKTS